MSNLRGLTAALMAQRRRLAQLVALCGGVDPEHPLQAFSLRRIKWLEARIEEERQKRA